MRNYSIMMLLGTILAGLAYALIADPIISRLEIILPGIVLVPAYMLGLFLFLGLAVYLIGKLVYSTSRSRINMKQWVLVLVLIIVCSLVFEFLYEIVRPKAKVMNIDSYIFVLDDSGSMLQNDPQFIRYQAVNKLLEDKKSDFQYAVYSFSSDCALLQDMQPISAGAFNPELPDESTMGMTEVLHTLRAIYNDIDSGALKLGKKTRIIFLSDGYATDLDIFNKYSSLVPLLDQYADKGVSISTVGLLNADDSLMSMIATKTGGEYIDVQNIDDLVDGMAQAGKLNLAKRHLLGYRPAAEFNILLGLMRILFVTGLGLIIAFEKTILCEKFLNTTSVLISSVVGGVLAGICIEVGMNLFGIHPTIMRTFTCILIAFTLLRVDLFFEHGQGREV